MHNKRISYLPCLTFFAAGQVITGLLTLIMQMTLFLWPTAQRWAREFEEDQAINALLNEFASTYKKLPEHHYSPSKRFRQTTVTNDNEDWPIFARAYARSRLAV